MDKTETKGLHGKNGKLSSFPIFFKKSLKMRWLPDLEHRQVSVLVKVRLGGFLGAATTPAAKTRAKTKSEITWTHE